MAIAGRVAIVPKGEYSNAITYDKLDLVMYNNDAYIAKKTSTGIEPTNEEYWMLILDNVVAEDLENIINGTTAVGKAKDADTVDGLHASDFVNSISPYFTSGETILSWANNPNGVYKKFVIHPNIPSDVPIQAEGWCELLIDKENNRKVVIYTQYGKNDFLSVYMRSIWNGAWRENWSRPFLPLTGGTLSGAINFNVGNNKFEIRPQSDFGSFIGGTNGKTSGESGYASGYLAIKLSNAIAERFQIIANGVTYNILHTGNKPSGSYTGNGSATKRTINVGGIGKILYVTGNNYGIIVTYDGAFGVNQSGSAISKPEGTCCFRDGVLQITSTDACINNNVTSYTYQVL